LENLLVASFVSVRLANDLGGVRVKRRISGPSAVSDICVQYGPRPTVVSRVVRLSMTVFAASGTAIFSGPDEVVRFWMKVEYSLAKGVWYRRGISGVPRPAGVCGVEEPLARSDGVCAVGRVFVVIKCEEGFLGVVLDPTVSFIARLPERVVSQANENGLGPFQR